MNDNEGPILYVLVIGFHHKKRMSGNVEYSYPPLVPGHPNECPPGWKYLPTLALPDGSHNYDEDTVFFHLPSLTKPKETVYGISCFRQIPVEKIKNLTSDITRGTVQKSVCVLSRIPLYGQIQVSILQDTYHHLNAVIEQNDTYHQTFVGLSARDFILQWKHKAVLLFKLLLLEKRVVFYKSPVHPLCTTILTLISLFPDMIESGLSHSTSIRLSRPMSPMPDFSDDDSPVKNKKLVNGELINGNQIKEENGTTEIEINKNSIETPNTYITTDVNSINDNTGANKNGDQINTNDNAVEVGIELTESEDVQIKDDNLTNIGEKSNSLRRDTSAEAIIDTLQNNMTYLAHINTKTCGFPLAIFTKGSLCLPYLSLPYLDLLSDVNVRSYVVGATNILFKQKRQLYDILVDIDGNRIECQDLNLRKHLHLTTEDLRFADYIVKHVSEERHDVFLDGVWWEGGDEWIRNQFKIYLLCLLRTSLLQDGSREIEHFNASFITTWRDTHNYKIWLSGVNPGILDVHRGILLLDNCRTMQSTESGRKINQAMASTGKAVATTSKAVGGALSQAKGAFSSWWSNFMVNPEPGHKGGEQGSEEVPSAARLTIRLKTI
ncbi:hypothetical protein NQ317_003703 [Molorchus minor]|uniref:UDENN domain-containing protein n=1 Tax=Molorchus minor TaxID=1323400 RepID=A0ABQ9K4J2_9CUCU|nr:hypothetical protein NQ317_003703 [Molorchus minor]